MKVLVGSTGLVGKTLLDKTDFDLKFNSSNIDKFNVLVPDESDLYLACLPATMWMVNKDLVADMENILGIIKNLKGVKFKNIVLFSTIEVYHDSPLGSTESHIPGFSKMIYGSNRHSFELLVRGELDYENLKIIRLPALFGNHLKKNLFYDLMNGHEVENISTTSIYQWYNLDNLWDDVILCKVREGEIFNLFSEPIPTKEIISEVFELNLENNLEPKIQVFRTNATHTGYWSDKVEILNQMKEFLNATRSK